MSGAIPYGRALAAAAGAAQGQQRNLGQMLSVWGGGRDWRGVRSGQLREDAHRAESDMWRRLQQEHQTDLAAQNDEQQNAIQEQAFQNNVYLERLRQSGRPNGGSMEDRLAEYEAKKKIAAEYPTSANGGGGGFKPKTIEEAAELARQVAAAKAESAGFKPKTLAEAVELAGGKAKASAEGTLPSAIKKIEATGGQQRQTVAARGAETRTTNEAKSTLDKARDLARDTFNWSHRDSAQEKGLKAHAERLQASLIARYDELAGRSKDHTLDREQRAKLAEEAHQVRVALAELQEKTARALAEMRDKTVKSEGAANRTQRGALQDDRQQENRLVTWLRNTFTSGENEKSRDAAMSRTKVAQTGAGERQDKALEASGAKHKDAMENVRKKAVQELQKQRSAIAVKAAQMAASDFGRASDELRGGELTSKKAGETDAQFAERKAGFMEEARKRRSRELNRTANVRTSLAVIPTMTFEEAFGEMQDLAKTAREAELEPEDFGTLHDALMRRLEELRKQ